VAERTIAASLSTVREIERLAGTGQFAQAFELLRRALHASPSDAVLWRTLGLLQLQVGDGGKALAVARRAVQLGGRAPESLAVLGRAHAACRDWPAAIAALSESLRLRPADPAALASLGLALQATGQLDRAAAAFRALLALDPNSVEGHQHLGTVLALAGRVDEATTHGARARSLAEQRLAVLLALGDQAMASGDAAQAFARYDEARRLVPTSAAAALGFGQACQRLGDAARGLEAIEEAARLAPGDVPVLRAAAFAAGALGLDTRAAAYATDVLARVSDPALDFSTRLRLPAILESHAHVDEVRARYADGLAALERAPPALDDPATTVQALPFLLAYHGVCNRELQIRLARLCAVASPELRWRAPHSATPRRRRDRLRVGFLSHFLRNHSIGNTTRGLVAELDRRRFEALVLHLPPHTEDETTRWLESRADGVVRLEPGLARLREQLAALELDVLFFQDIGMERWSYYLGFARIAPVQCLSFGHPDTTGLPELDYFVSNDLYEPVGAAAHYSETLHELRGLPTLAYYYRPEPGAPGSRAEFGLPAEGSLYLCPQSLFKVHPDLDLLLGGILRGDPRARVVFIDGMLPEWSHLLAKRFARTLPDVAARILFVPRVRPARFCALLALADVVLDTPQFNGMNTSLQALSIGAPVVTLPTGLQRGRHTRAMYLAMGYTELVASDPDTYVQQALRLGTEPAFAREVRGEIVARADALFEQRAVVAAFEEFFVEAVARARVERA
jgi:predicted O-linked N-acetylglucosamine transferase (SPINDLY family)